MQTISSFRGDYAFLSNFHIHPFIYRGIEWLGSEWAYQAMKDTRQEIWQQIAQITDPKLVKKAGSRKGIAQLRENWDVLKLGFMAEILDAKFSQPELAKMLDATGDAYLIEGNNWRDRYWGVFGKAGGRNWLGILLMARREFQRRNCRDLFE